MNPATRRRSLLLLLSLAVPVSQAADPPGVFDPAPVDDSPAAPAVRTHHTAVINGAQIEFDVVAGETILNDSNGNPAATVFSTAYLRTDIDDGSKRPILFLFNGGPGASSSPLHLGIGPVRRSATDPDAPLVPNEHSPLDAVDMVFVDPVGTGFTRLFYDGAGSHYWGINEDADANLEYLARWLADNGRGDSPVFIMGESYGGMRAAAMLARTTDVRFRGALLLSPAIDFSAGSAVVGNNLPYLFLVPSMAATAAYHGVTDTSGAAYREVFEQAAVFALSDFAAALYRGNGLGAEERATAAEALASHIGLPPSYLVEEDLRVSSSEFWDELLADRGLRVGRLDARITGPTGDFEDRRPPYNDPSMSGGGGESRSTSELLMEYFRGQLGTEIDRHYRTLNLDANSKWNWKQQEGFEVYFSVLPRLNEALDADSALKVWVGGGVFDLATPVMAWRYAMSQLPVSPERFSFALFEAGHSVFDHEESRADLAREVREFVALAMQPTPDEVLVAFFEEKRAEDIARSPELKNSLGIDEDQDLWTPVSDERKKENAERAAARLEDLAAVVDYDSLTDAGKLNYDLYKFELDTDLLRWEYERNAYAFTRTPFDPYAARVQFLVSRHRIGDTDDAENYIARMAGLAETLGQLQAATAERAARGIVLPKFNFDDIANTSRQIASGRPCEDADFDNRLWTDFKTKVGELDIPAADRETLENDASRTLAEITCPAYRKFAETFDRWGEDVTRNDGIWATPNGDHWYRVAIRLFLTREMDPQAIHDTGLAEVARIEAEIARLMEADGFDGTLDEYYRFLSTKPGMVLPQTDEGRDAYIAAATAFIDDMAAKLPDWFSVLPQAPVVAKAVEKERERFQGGAFYVPPPLTGDEPGTFYVNLARMDEQPLWQLESLTYHEAIPGHHLQISLAREGEGYPEFRKSFSNSAFVEGWALYAEKLAKEMGAYPPRDPGDVGRLHYELVRAVRLVVDTGFHYKRWTIEDSAQYIADHLQREPDSAMREMERYANWPGQALAYKLGELEIEALRARAAEALGDDFDIGGFHTVILNQGVLSFDLLEAEVMHWVDAQRTGH